MKIIENNYLLKLNNEIRLYKKALKNNQIYVYPDELYPKDNEHLIDLNCKLYNINYLLKFINTDKNKSLFCWFDFFTKISEIKNDNVFVSIVDKNLKLINWAEIIKNNFNLFHYKLNLLKNYLTQIILSSYDVNSYNYDLQCFFNDSRLYEDGCLSKEFIDSFKQRVNWRKVIKTHSLSETFLEKNIYFIEAFNTTCWIDISERQILSEEFIEKYQDKVSWDCIAYSQKLSNKFISKYIDKLQFNSLKFNKNIDQKFISKLELLK